MLPLKAAPWSIPQTTFATPHQFQKRPATQEKPDPHFFGHMQQTAVLWIHASMYSNCLERLWWVHTEYGSHPLSEISLQHIGYRHTHSFWEQAKVLREACTAYASSKEFHCMQVKWSAHCKSQFDLIQFRTSNSFCCLKADYNTEKQWIKSITENCWLAKMPQTMKQLREKPRVASLSRSLPKPGFTPVFHLPSLVVGFSNFPFFLTFPYTSKLLPNPEETNIRPKLNSSFIPQNP